MKYNNRSCRILAIVMCMMMLASCMGFAADGNRNDGLHTMKYTSTWTRNSNTMSYYYMDRFVQIDTSKYNSHLATASLALAMAGGDVFDNNIKAVLEDLEFEGYTSQDYGSTTDESIGIAVARKKLDDGRILVPVVIRGAQYHVEWAQNVTAGASGDAEGFAKPAKKVVDFVHKYVGKEKKVLLWVVGYSRGASVAYLSAKDLTDEYGSDGVVAYCFEAPRAALAPVGVYKNIHHVRNVNDGIPLVLPEYMNFGIYGEIDKYIGDGNEDAMMSFLPQVTRSSKEYFSAADLHWGRVKLLNLSEKKLYELKTEESAKNIDVWNEIVSKIQRIWPTREEYISGGEYSAEKSLSATLKLYNILTDDEKETLKSSLGGNILGIFKLVTNDDLLCAFNSILKGEEPKLEDREYRVIADDLYNAFISMTKLDAEKKALAKTACRGLIKPLLRLIAIDYKSGHQIVGTLILEKNIDRLIGPHYPEVSMAWMMTHDSYYNGVQPVNRPGRPAITAVKASGKTISVKWNKKAADGYQLQYSTDSKFKSGKATASKIVSAKAGKTVAVKISKLKSGNKYYVRVRAYNKEGKSSKVYGRWSTVKSVKLK